MRTTKPIKFPPSPEIILHPAKRMEQAAAKRKGVGLIFINGPFLVMEDTIITNAE
jgi:hypothetical protein